jgi:uncharacterized protein involved in exopolysaccharide biosynthesis
MEKEYDLQDISIFLKRRKKILSLTFFILFFLGLLVAVVLPPIYESEAMIRIEDQQIPEDFVQPTITDYAEERIEKISQQVLSRPKLLDIIKQFDLYPEMQAQKSPTELIKKIRKDIEIETIAADLKSKKIGRNITVTVAFNLSYEGKDPIKVQKVANTLSNLYLEEDMKRRKIRVSGTAEFLKAELNSINIQIDRYEKKISTFKKRHIRNLPSDSGYNLQAIARLERELDTREMRKRLLEEKKLIIESQLANVEPLTPIVIDGEDLALSPNERLKSLRLELTRMQSVYSEKHPDIKKLKREIIKLEKVVRNSEYSVQKVKRLNQLEGQLASATSALGPNHPDVKAIKREIDIINNEIQNSITKTTKIKISEEKPDNPTYINLTMQIKTIEVEMKRLEEDKRELLSDLNEYRSRIDSGPAVEKELNALKRGYQNLQNKYTEISNKLMNAQLVKEMENKKKGRTIQCCVSCLFAN